MRLELPSGTVTFLFTDVEGSTKLLHQLGAEAYAEALAEHRRVIREACARHDGVEVDTQGDAFFFAFPTAPDALAAVGEMTEALASGAIQVRVGLHTGTPLLTEEGYVGDDVHLAARVAASGHGGQVVVSSATAALFLPSDKVSQGISLLDLGEHRLKDIEGSVSIFQLGVRSFPPLKTISNTNLPRPASSFVGRERELAEVLSRIEAGARLVTLTGPGGSGKTRLALEAASSLVPEYKAGVFWVGLASLRDSALVTETISQTLGAKDGLAEHIAEREMLLLLDNLEQVIEAAPELSVLLAACPNLTLLVTSRELLRVQGEVEYPVPPLVEPEAVSLFCERAQVEPSDDIGELCTRLDSLPLAVELAAARVKALSPAQILERLSQRLDLLKGGRDADPRQQTLRATVEWSYELLSPEEQQLFARLSVFAGGCALKAAEEVAGADLNTLQSLVEKSLLRFTNERYWMLETIREYAAERFEAAAEAEELYRRHAEHFLVLAEEAEPYLSGGDPKEWLDRLDREHDNVRRALDGLAEAGETQRVLALASAVENYWAMRGHLREGRHRLESALTADEERSSARARALFAAAHLAGLAGDHARERHFAEEALELYGELGDAKGIARSRLALAWLVAVEEDWATAKDLFEVSIAEFTALGQDFETLSARRSLAWMYEELGDLGRYRELTEENLSLARSLGNKRIEARCLGALAMLALDEGRLADATAMMTDSLQIDRELGFSIFVAIDLTRFAAISAAAGKAAIGTQLIARADAQNEEIGSSLESWAVAERARTLELLHEQLDAAAFAEAWDEGLRMTVDEAIALALESLD